MTQFLFDHIVALLNFVCAQTGISYATLNILVYCLFIPWTWFFILCVRRRWFRILVGATAAAIAAGSLVRGFIMSTSRHFYDSQIQLLYQIAGGDEGRYIQLSLVIGAVVPFLITALLLLFPKRTLLAVYLTINALLLAFLLLGLWTGRSVL